MSVVKDESTIVLGIFNGCQITPTGELVDRRSIKPDDGLLALERAIVGMADGQDTSPMMRLFIGCACREKKVRLALRQPNNRKGQPPAPAVEVAIAGLVHEELQRLPPGRGSLTAAYKEVGRRIGKTPKRIEQIWRAFERVSEIRKFNPD